MSGNQSFCLGTIGHLQQVVMWCAFQEHADLGFVWEEDALPWVMLQWFSIPFFVILRVFNKMFAFQFKSLEFSILPSILFIYLW